MELVDIGANLAHEAFDADREAVLARAAAAGVARIVVTGASEAESRAAQALAATRPGVLFATAGVHPHHAGEWRASSATWVGELAALPEVVAIGETGLDFYRDLAPRALQERVFEAHIELAAGLGMPLFVHEREAHERLAALLARHRDRLGAVVVHCFTGGARALDAYLEMDLHIGITGWICDERRGLHLRELVARIPLERLMIETDAPYLLPRDLRPRPRTRRNEPMHLAHVARTVAACRGVTPERLAAATTRTAERFFGLPRSAG